MQTVKRNYKGILLVLVAVVLIAAAVLCAIFLREAELEREQNEALTLLEEQRGTYDEYTVVLSDTTRSEAEALAKRIGARLRISADGSFATLTLTDGRTIRDVYADDANRTYLSSFSADYKASVSGRYADTEHRYPEAPTVGNKQELSATLDYLHLGDLWQYTKGNGVTVAVIDTGIDTNHPELAGRISEYSYNATEDKIVKDWTLEDGSYDWSLVEDEQGHGTSVAGALGAAYDGLGTVGVAPAVTIIAIKAECNERGEFARTSDLVFGLYYAIERDASVVNMSFGSQNAGNPFAAATQLAYDSDVLCIAAAGNEATAALTYPAADPLVIGVGALANDSWELADYSNYGENVDVVAPGSVYTAAMGGGYKTAEGTSLASPLVAGVMALLVSRDRYITYDRATELLYASSYDLGALGADFDYGYGAVDAYALIMEERGTLTLDMMTDELEDSEGLFIRNHTLQQILEPERYFAVFDGWYYDPYYTEPYNYYADVFSSDITLYAKWSGEDDGVPFTYVELSDGTVEIRSYTGRRRFISVPESIDGKPVTSIGDFAFAGEGDLREINLPSGLTNIGRYAFENCVNLTTIEIPAGVRTLGERAFYNNVRLSSVGFAGDSALTSVGREAFAYCSSLRRFELPARVTSFDGSVLLGTTSLGAIGVQKGNAAFTSVDGVLFNRTQSTLVAYPAGLSASYTVPVGVNTVGSYAFAYTKAHAVDLRRADAVLDGAFAYSSLTAVTLPDSVRTLGVQAFYGSPYLASVSLGSGLTAVPGEAFAVCPSLTEITLPKGILTVGMGAFSGDTALSSVSFAEDSRLREIGASAFSDCALTELVLPPSVVTLGAEAFANNYFLATVSFGEDSHLRAIGASAFACEQLPGALTSVVLPEGLEQLGDFAFSKQSITGEQRLPAKLSYLGAGAFAFNTALTDFRVDAENIAYVSVDGVVYTADREAIVAYPVGNARTSYALLDSTKVVDIAALYSAQNLTSLSLDAGLTEIRELGIAYATALTRIQIPDSVIQIGRRAFLMDKRLSSIAFGTEASIARLGFESLAYTGITSLTIPRSVSTIAQGALSGNTRLTSVTFAEDSELSSISAYMFDGADNLRSITFLPGSALTSIQAHGLEGMRRLTSVDFGDAKLSNIDNFAFRFCENLSSFTVPDTVTSIGRYAFYACYGLTSVTVPESVEHIGSFAFLANPALELYFTSNTLPIYLDEDWDHGIKGYYLGVTNVTTDGDFKYAALTDGHIAILEYTGDATALDLNTLGYGNITVIGGDAFAYASLESVVLPETLVTVQKRAFYHSNLKHIAVPASVEFIGNAAFADTPIESLTFAANSSLKVIEQSAFELTERLSGTVEIPASVTTLGRAIFRDSAVTGVTFENGTAIAEIPDEAFANSALTAFTAPDSVTKIGDGAFRGAKALKSFSYGTGELWLGANAFYQSGLESFHVGENITMIEEFALTSLEALTAFTVDADNPYYKEVDGLLVSKGGKKLISVPAGRTGALTVPASVEIIGFGAFEATALDSVTFSPDANILAIGYRAFFGAKSLTELTVPASVVTVDYYAFAYAKQLARVTFAEGSRLTGIYEGAFYGCNRLSDITLPVGIVEISDFAFYGCSKLTRLPVSEGAEIKGIYSYAFAYSGLSGELTLPDSLMNIGAYAFLGIKAETVTIPSTNAKELIIGIGVFEEARDLTEITLPFIGASYEDMDITWLGYIFGAGSYEANATYVPESLKKVNINGDITFIGMHAFDGLVSLEEIGVPASVTALYDYAFNGTTAKYELKSAISLWTVDYNGNSVMQTFAYYGCFGNGGISGQLSLNKGITSVVGSTFEDCRGLTSIDLPEGLTSIGFSAFEGCTSLTSIDLPEGLTSIGISAFEGCTSLTSIDLPEGLTSIGFYAFYRCSSLTSIELPERLTSIGDNAFYGCKNLMSIELPSGVTSIGDYAFGDCNSLTSIELSEGVISIGSQAFYNCTSLASIDLPESVTSIGDWAFYGCTSLTSIDLPESLTSIDSCAFANCSKLYCVTNRSALPITLDNSAEYGEITAYAKLLVDKDGNKHYRDEDSGFAYVETPDGFLFIKENGAYTLTAYLGREETVTLPTDIDGHSYEIYRMHGVRNVIVPEGVTSIGDWAFYGCMSLTSIDLPESVTSIGSQAFINCTSLTSIDLPEGLISIGSSAFSYCSGLTSITIPDGVTRMDNFVFHGCTSLQSVAIPEGVTVIGQQAFDGCTTLRSLRIPTSVMNISTDAFANCQATVTVAEDSQYFTDVGGILYDKALTRIVYVPTTVREVVIPKTVTSIYKAFDGCSNLTKVEFEEGSVIDFIGNFAFRDCKSLTSIEIPESVTSIDSYAFSDCTSLTSIDLPEGVISIGERAFQNCSSLTSIDLPEGVISIGERAFQNCSSLTSIDLPESVTSIGEVAFYRCSSLTSIDLPESVTSIGEFAFFGCPAAVTVAEGNQHFTEVGGILYDKALTRIVYVPTTVREVVIPKTVTSIYQAFDGCSNLTKAEFEEGTVIDFIGSSAFGGCTSLTSIDLPEGVTSIDEWAFSDCTSLTSIDLPEGLTSIGGFAFYRCSSLMSIELPERLTSIGDNAFYGCRNLMSIELPSGVTSIGNSAFDGCYALSQVINHSTLLITLDNYAEYGNITLYAKALIDRDGNTYYKDGTTDFIYIDTADGFRFEKENGAYKLVAYFGSEETVTLPIDIVGNPYEIYHMRGVKNVIVPEGLTSIGNSAFLGCTSLTSIYLPEGVTSIDNLAFQNCSSLTRIDLPEGLTSIGNSAFKGCTSLTSIKIPDSVTSIGMNAFDNTAYYTDAFNWVDGALYIGNHLIAVDPSAKRFVVREGTKVIAWDAFEGCYSLKHLTIGGNHSGILSLLTNPETLIITEMPTEHDIFGYFGYNIPITLKNIVLTSGVKMRSYAFQNLSGITIYVEDTEADTQWDKNYPGWSNGNRVAYGDEWITAEFYDHEGNILASEIFSTSQVIRVPYLEIAGDAQYSYILDGFDTDGDGIADAIPATSATDITARAVVRREARTYTATYLDKDGKTPLYTVTLPYGSEITLPEDPEKTGYEFLGWQGYEGGMTVTGDLVFASSWAHEGEGHAYAAPVWVGATCTTGGYNKHVCTVCGEWYATDESEPTGHSHERTVVAPTCTEGGYDRYLCACGDEYREGFTAPTGHAFTEWVVDTPATCEGDGLRYHVCYTCGESEDEIIAAVGHTYTAAVTRDATCTREGEIVYTCSCGDSIVESVPMTGHSYEQTYASKSFLRILIEMLLDIFFGYEGDRGYYFRCSDCGHIATEDEAVSTYFTSASVKDVCEHQLGDWTLVYEADCIDSAVEGRNCSLCKEVVEARSVGEPLGHSYEDTVVAPTHTERGYTAHVCEACADTYYTDFVDAVGHSYSAVVTTPTCEKDGYTTYTCTCGDEYVSDIVSATEHTYTHIVTAPTCTAQGYTTHTCTCGDSYVDNYTNVTGHTASAWVTDKDATHESVGYKHTECTVCDVILETAEIATTGHTYTNNVTVPTCTAQGYTTHTCTCGDSYVDSYTNATGHTETVLTGKAATCTETGLTGGTKCSVCGVILAAQVEIPVTAHTYDGGCGEACTVCGAVRTLVKHTDADADGACDACGASLSKDGLSKGAVAGIAAGSTAAAGAGGFSLFWFVIKKKRWADLAAAIKK